LGSALGLESASESESALALGSASESESALASESALGSALASGLLGVDIHLVNRHHPVEVVAELDSVVVEAVSVVVEAVVLLEYNHHMLPP
jgi:hypothetical protein